MSDAGDGIAIDTPVEEVKVPQETPKGKLSVEDTLQCLEVPVDIKDVDSKLSL
ncbi:hypothetical protein B0H19DRAFT_1264469 [Mycena capillaripes]|nr:hypothetical protein B0H19DRAFT_1264469 [Mycena capillaripes]